MPALARKTASTTVGRRKNHKGEQRHRVVGESVLLRRRSRRPPQFRRDTQQRTDQKQAQADAHAAAHFSIDGFLVDREPEISMPHAVCPAAESLRHRSLVIQVEGGELRVDHGRRWRRVAAFEIRAGIQSGSREKVVR